ncbi:MAG: DNA polymerase I [bacterium]
MDTKAKVVIIDSYSLLYRAFYALPPLTNKAGEVTNAVYGFTNMLFKLLDEVAPEYVVAAFDMHGATFRHEASADYKATRKPMPDDLRPQIPMAREVLETMGIPVYGVVGFEADDVIGTLARMAADEGHDVIVVTSDKDALQLVNDRVSVLSLKKGMTDTVTYDAAGVVERLGVTPAQVPDLKALMGDNSDNIPGVPGIGEKTAGKLVAQYGTLEEVLAHAEEIKGKLGASLVTYAEQARMSLHLATIDTAVPLVDFNWDSCHRNPWDAEKLRALFTHLNFRSLLPRVATNAALVPEDVQAEFAPLLKTTILTDVKEISRLAEKLRGGNLGVAMVNDDGLAGLALANATLSVYLPLREAPPAQVSLFDEDIAPAVNTDRLHALTPLLESADTHWSTFDVKELLLALRGAGVAFAMNAFDTMLAGYVIDPTGRFTLEDLVQNFLGQHRESSDLRALWRTGDVTALATAAGEIAQLNLRLEAPMSADMAEKGVGKVYHELELPLVPILAEMEARGMALDAAHLGVISEDLGKRIYAIEGDIYREAGERFTINSPKQLQTILFDKLGLQHGRKTKTGYSTGADTLALLAEDNEIVRDILSYRELSKLKSTYVDALPPMVNPTTGHIHTHWNQAIAATGRLSSKDPNLQNIPIRTVEGREIRACFIPGEDGWVLLAADYSQIELRVLAHITGDEAMTEIFRTGGDLHSATAMHVFGVSADAVTREMRRIAKVVNFAIPYGTTAFGLATQTGVSREMAEELRRNYLERFSGIAQYMVDVVARARHDGYVTTILGRRRPIPDINAANPNVRQAAERTAINTPIQGSAADIMKLAMLRLDKELKGHPELRAHLLLQVHDEVVLETPAEEVEALAALTRTSMREAYPLSVPMEVEVKVGPNWRDVSPQVEDIGIEIAEE